MSTFLMSLWACGMNVFTSEYVAARPELVRQRDAFRQRMMIGNAPSSVHVDFYGDSTLRNVFCALCNSLTTVETYVGNYDGNGTHCSGWLGPSKRVVAAYYFRSFSLFLNPLPATTAATTAATHTVFFGMALWLAWPSPFHSPLLWKGYDSWRHYEDHVAAFVNAVRERHPKARAVAVSGHSVCGPGCLATYPHALPTPPQLPCIHYVLHRHHNHHNLSSSSVWWTEAERMCTQATCGDGEVVVLNARLYKAMRSLPWIDTYQLTHNQCWANDGDDKHYPFLVFNELALYASHIWTTTFKK